MHGDSVEKDLHEWADPSFGDGGIARRSRPFPRLGHGGEEDFGQPPGVEIAEDALTRLTKVEQRVNIFADEALVAKNLTLQDNAGAASLRQVSQSDAVSMGFEALV